MLIPITGVHGTGKTSLLNAIVENDKTFIEYTLSLGRKLLDMGLDQNSEKFQISIISGLSSTELALHSIKEVVNQKKKNVLLSRSMIDTHAYSKVMLEEGKISQDTFDMSYKALKFSVDNGLYEKVFYLHPEFELIDNGYRPMDIEYRNKVAEAYISTLEEFNIEYVKLTGTVEERVAQFLKEF